MIPLLQQVYDRHCTTCDRKVPSQDLQRRLTVCEQCKYRQGERCSRCGLSIGGFSPWKAYDCPEGYWRGYKKPKPRPSVPKPPGTKPPHGRSFSKSRVVKKKPIGEKARKPKPAGKVAESPPNRKTVVRNCEPVDPFQESPCVRCGRFILPGVHRNCWISE